jgi:hypothetical protein
MAAAALWRDAATARDVDELIHQLFGELNAFARWLRRRLLRERYHKLM